MNVLLVYPEVPDTFWSFKYALKFLHKKAGSPPVGLLTVAAMLPKEWNKRLVDLQVTKLTEKDLAWADMAMISAMTVQRKSAHEVIARCRKAGIKTVVGGPLFTIEHHLFPDVDHFVLNEAELTLAPFLADLEKGCAQRIYSSTEFASIAETPVPMWELADLKQYGWMSVQYSRGCPFRCDFCNVTSLFGYRPRTKSSVQILAELNAIYDVGWRGNIFFVDDNFIGNKHHLKSDLLPALIKWQEGKRVPFHTESSINLADDEELMSLMVAAGFHMVFVGIETPSAAGLADCNKKQNEGRDLVADVKRLQRAGLHVQGGFILGFDSDTPSIFQRQIDFIQQSGVVMAMVGLLQAIPGTGLYDRLLREGRVTEKLSTGDNVDGTTNIVHSMGAEGLREGYMKVLRHIYKPKFYYRRLKTFLREYQKPPITEKVRTEHVWAFIRSTVRLGIIGRERWQYWKILTWTYFRRRELFPLAVSMAICGYHFRRTAEAHVR
jgi:radical SAM superfamily enzyme YgiQ (UPF0313 family)